MKTENVAESHQTDIPYTFPAGHETKSSLVLQQAIKTGGVEGLGSRLDIIPVPFVQPKMVRRPENGATLCVIHLWTR